MIFVLSLYERNYYPLHHSLLQIVMTRDIADLNMSLADSTSTLRQINSTVHFVVTMVTTARAELVLEINFGDGFVYNHSLRDVNETFILGGEQNVAHLHLTADYGEGCQLFVSLDHKYVASGVFRPSVSVHSVLSADMTAHASLSEPLLIQRTLSDVVIEARAVYSTNESAILSVTMPVVTANISCAWIIYYKNESVTESSDCEFMYTFTDAGSYIFHVTAQNLVSDVLLEKTISVQDVITGLQIENQGDVLIPTGSGVTLLAHVTSGTTVNFVWDFSDPFDNPFDSTTSVGLLDSDPYTSIANHTYTTSGRYNVSVTAYNLVSTSQVYLPIEFVVQDSIQGVSLPPMITTVLHDPTAIEVQVLQGSDLDFRLDFGTGSISPLQVEQIHGSLYIMQYVFPMASTYEVTVIASNGVSSDNATMLVVIKDDIGSVTVSMFHPRNNMAILVANIDGK